MMIKLLKLWSKITGRHYVWSTMTEEFLEIYITAQLCPKSKFLTAKKGVLYPATEFDAGFELFPWLKPVTFNTLEDLK